MTRAFNFGAKLAASSCSPCDMPNSPTNKKHMTGASPAVTEAGEHSEEIGKPEVVETEHSEAEAKQPEEGIKSAANFGKMLGGMFGAAKPAANNAADLATSLGAKAKATAARTGNNVVMTNPATGLQETLAHAGGDLKPAWLRNNEAVARGIDPKTGVRPGSVAPTAPPPKAPPARSPAEAARAQELGLKPSDYVDGTPYAIPNSVANSSQTLTPRPVPVRQTGKVINGATGQVTGGPQPAPSYVTANRDARATALAKARSAQNPPPMPPTPRQFGESVYAQKPGSPMDFPQPPLPKPVSPSGPTAPPPPASYRSRAADDFNYGRTPLAPMPKKPAPPPAELTLE